MSSLFRSVLDIALLRRDPSVLPASGTLLALAAAGFAAASALLSWMQFGGDRIWQRTAFDLGLACVLFWLLLAVTRRGHRFRQTMTAVLGTAIVVTPVVAAILLLHRSAAAHEALRLVVGFSSIAVIVWYTLIIGHILRSALEVGFVTSIAIAVTWLFAGDVLASRLFGVAG